MPPLDRQDTRPSIHSWWSDSNPGLHGPTINLHVVAKPLLKRMYHRQALQLIRKNRDSPLSTATLEIYLSYFPWNYVSSSTKDAILVELIARSVSEADTRTMLDTPVFNFFTQMLGSPDAGARISSCRFLANLARHECTTSAIVEQGTCERLVSLLRWVWLLYLLARPSSSDRDEDSGVIEWAAYALSEIACWLDATEAIVHSIGLDHILVLLKSPTVDVRKWTCGLLGHLARDESTVTAVLQLKPYEQLVSLLGDEDSRVVARAIYALSQIVRWLDSAQVIVDAMVLDHVVVLLESPRSDVRKYTCGLVGHLARDETTAEAVLRLKPYKQLVSLLADQDARVIARAMYALSQIARSADGAQAVVDAMALDYVLVLLASRSPEVRNRTRELLEYLASHGSTAPAVLEFGEFLTLNIDPAKDSKPRLDAVTKGEPTLNFRNQVEFGGKYGWEIGI